MGGGHRNNGVDSDGVLVEAALHNISLCFVWLVLTGFARRAFIVHVVLFWEYAQTRLFEALKGSLIVCHPVRRTLIQNMSTCALYSWCRLELWCSCLPSLACIAIRMP